MKIKEEIIEKPRTEICWNSRELCKLCYHVNAIGFNVPDDIWRAVVPAAMRGSIVCLACFARLGDEKGIAWDQQIEFYPVSMATHLGTA